jgi:putative heme-binding domain-containing protein
MLLKGIVLGGLFSVQLVSWILAQGDKNRDIANPLAHDRSAIVAGQAQYQAACGGCHGATGNGGRGPRLVGVRGVKNMSDGKMFETIQQGVQGTPMPPFALSDTQIWQLVSFIRNLNATAIDQEVSGDSTAGQALFFGSANCSECHMIRGRGGLLGPDLSNVASTRSVESILESLKVPSALVEPGYAGVSVVTMDGRRISGILKNESNYSIQILDAGGNFHSFLKKELKELVRRKKSLMPDPSLSDSELQNLLAFLSRQSLDVPAQEAKRTAHGQVKP